MAHAFFPPIPPNAPTVLQGDAHFDEAEVWAVTVPIAQETFDLVTVMAHEFGHSLDQGYTNVAGALMAPVYNGSHRFLHSDDSQGIRSLYGVTPIDHAMWTHGTGIQVEYADRIESMQRLGFHTRITGKPNTKNWFHFAIPTPVIVDRD